MSQNSLSRDRLQTAEAVLSLGITIAHSLANNGIAIMFVNDEGNVEHCPLVELSLDFKSEEEAINILLDKGYSDELLLTYLKGRSSRGKLHG